MWMTYARQTVSAKDDGTLVRPPTKEPFRIYTPSRFLEVRRGRGGQIFTPCALFGPGERELIERCEERTKR
jgi:hypothetical protein